MASMDYVRDICDALEKQKINYLLFTLQKRGDSSDLDSNNFEWVSDSEITMGMIQILEEKLADLKQSIKQPKKE